MKSDSYGPHEDVSFLTVLFVIVAVTVAFILIVSLVSSKRDHEALIKMKETCETLNGALLDNTKIVGTRHMHRYVCVDKKTVIEYN